MTFKEKVNLMNFIFRIYPNEWEIRQIEEQHLHNDRSRFKEHVDSVLNLLPAEQRKILEKEFIEHAAPGWWIAYYSKSRYYRLKGQGMEAFIEEIRKND